MRYEENIIRKEVIFVSKKYFVFSDVHGEFDSLLASLQSAGFDHENTNHHLISLGDNFDRGIYNAEIFEFLLKMKDQGRFQGIMGNHDQMLVDFMNESKNWRFNYAQNGLDTTIKSFSKTNSDRYIRLNSNVAIDKINENYPRLMEFLNDLEDIIEIDDYVLTHAGFTHNRIIRHWEVDNWAMTEEFVGGFHRSDLYDPNKKYVFGHWHNYRLRVVFLGRAGENGELNHNIFEYKNFIGLDAATNLSKKVNILTF